VTCPERRHDVTRAAIFPHLAQLPSNLFRLLIASAALVFLSAPSIDSGSARDTNSEALSASINSATFAKELEAFTVQGEALLDDEPLTAQARNAGIPLAKLRQDRMAPFRSIKSGSASYATALNCLTEAIYYEAANESVAGKQGVAQVILNRVAHPAYPSTVCGVVYQGYADPVCQFSYTCDGSLARRPLPGLWRQSRDVAAAALGGFVDEQVGTATHYHADYVVPYWAYRLDKVRVEGRHIFYSLPGYAGRSANFTARWGGREFKPAFDPDRHALAASDSLGEEHSLAQLSVAERDPTDRRAENDVGGRLDTSTTWRLSIPDPVTASSGYRAALDGQAGAAQSAQHSGSSE